MDKNAIVLSLIEKFCKEKLDAEYNRLCKKVYEDLLNDNPEIFNRGKVEIWAAAIIWATGSVNFLDDKSFLPYATLSDVCSFFNTNNSTVGQKASIIRSILNMDIFTREYLRKDSKLPGFIDRLQVNEDGFIFLQDEEEPEPETNKQEPAHYLIKLTSTQKITTAHLYQLELLFKKSITPLEEFHKINIAGQSLIHITYFGDLTCIKEFTEKIKRTSFAIIEIEPFNDDELME
jgi:hypothetical protein